MYPPLKSSIINVPVVMGSDKNILVTQYGTEENTSYIKRDYPLMWKYLEDNNDYFSNGKSNIILTLILLAYLVLKNIHL